MRRGLAVAAWLAAGLVAGETPAHPMPNSTVVIVREARAFDADVSIPLEELEAALGGPVRLDAAGRETLEAYVRAHVAVVDAQDRRWPMGVMQMAIEPGDHPALALRLRFPRPAGAPGGATLRYDAVNHRIASHYVLVYQRGAEPEAPLRPLGRLQFPGRALRLGP